MLRDLPSAEEQILKRFTFRCSLVILQKCSAKIGEVSIKMFLGCFDYQNGCIDIKVTLSDHSFL